MTLFKLLASLLVTVFIGQSLICSTCFGLTNLVRVNLEKSTNPQAGHLGQSVTSYYVNLAIGTPPKQFKMLIDVNARETWLPHYSRMGIILYRLNYKNGYSKRDSSTSVKEDKEVYTIGYRGSEFSGKAYSDVIGIMNVTESVNPVKITQRFLAISDASNDGFMKYNVDGVLSLNPWPVSETGSEMPIISMGRAKLINELKFALSFNTEENSSIGGELTLGGLNPTKFMGALRYHKVIAQHSWELNLNGIMLGAETINCGDDKCTALISTALNDIYGPPAYIKKILKFFGHSDIDSTFAQDKLYEIDCLKVATAPQLTFIIDDAYYMLHPLSYIKKRTEGRLFKSEVCYIALISNGSTNKWELGTNFLSNYYTVFNLDQRQIAFGIRTQS